ncbi:MAG: hypothetical protein ACXW1A_05425 [Nitrososphaeraceae archaeon]
MIKEETLYEVILPRRSISQPHPKIYQYGDCGACVLCGLLNLADPSLSYKLFQENGDIEPFSYVTMRSALYSAKSRGFIDRLIDDHPIWIVYKGHMTWGNVSWKQSLEWFKYINMAIDAGYYGIASINIDGKGPLVDTDHVVLFCGVRERIEQNKYIPEAGNVIQEILISCSGRHPEGKWYDIVELLKYRGGFNCFLARPK